jgi:hypothetical protein
MYHVVFIVNKSKNQLKFYLIFIFFIIKTLDFLWN